MLFVVAVFAGHACRMSMVLLFFVTFYFVAGVEGVAHAVTEKHRMGGGG